MTEVFKLVVWGSLAAVLGILTSLVPVRCGLVLIADRFRPECDVTASGLSAMAYFVAIAMCRDLTRRKLQTSLHTSILLLVLSAAVCLTFTFGVGMHAFSSRLVNILLSGTWFCAYVTVFISLAVSITSTVFLVIDRRKKPNL